MSSAGAAFRGPPTKTTSRSRAPARWFISWKQRLGVKLIDRSKRPFVLTPEGEVYYEGCRKLVERYDALEDKVRTLHEEVVGPRARGLDLFGRPAPHEPLPAGVPQPISQGQRAAGVSASAPGLSKRRKRIRPTWGWSAIRKSSRTIEAIDWREEPMVLVCAPEHRAGRPRPHRRSSELRRARR